MRSGRSRASHACPLPLRPSFDRVSYEAEGRGSAGWLCRTASWCCPACGRGYVWGRKTIEGGSAVGWLRAAEVDSYHLRQAWNHDEEAARQPSFSRERRKLRRAARDHRFWARWRGDA